MKVINRFIWICLAALATSLLADPAPPLPPVPTMAGDWTFVPDRSTDLSPWGTLDLGIVIDGSDVTVRRHFANGDRTTDTVMKLDLDLAVNVVPVPWWMDNRHIGAYIDGDRTEHVRASWVDDGRILRTNADLVLDAQQGPRSVNVLTDYKISPSGNELTVIELRSTRPIPIVYVFRRSPPPSAPLPLNPLFSVPPSPVRKSAP